jgi:hypothetical protein
MGTGIRAPPMILESRCVPDGPRLRSRYWLMCQPPFGDSTWPVTNFASSLAR